MATRGEIRDAVTSEMKAVSGTYDVEDADGSVISTVTLDASDIGLRNPEPIQSLPAIAYHENYRRVRYNDVGAGPDMTVYNDDGSVAHTEWREYIEGQFIIDVRAGDEVAKEPIYEALRTQFGQYQFLPWPETDLHQDVIDITVEDSTTVDTTESEDVIRGDQLEVRVTFHRSYVLDTDNITSVETAVDADLDGTDDQTYTTT